MYPLLYPLFRSDNPFPALTRPDTDGRAGRPMEVQGSVMSLSRDVMARHEQVSRLFIINGGIHET